jgi:uncharacterized protein (DUF1800 family)
MGYEGWIQAQASARWTSLASTVEQDYRERLASNPAAKPQKPAVLGAFWQQAFTSEAQLRMRVAYALSQIFVVSQQSRGGFDLALGHANYFDTLASHAFGSYRQLLEAVARHPVMGVYLSHRANLPASEAIGRVPDENFAREIMQLFSIGLVQLNQDGSPKRDASGNPIPTYDPSDISGLAHVFTGWSWDCGGPLTTQCFFQPVGLLPDPRLATRPMRGYPQYHSTAAKRFLGTTVPAQTTPNPAASLKVALDTIAAHPNVGPFIGRQLIQRLVTSNPSPAYVAAVAAVFNDNGRGVRGDLGAVVRTILLHPEARQPGRNDGKVREPVLRLSALGRAYPVQSASGTYRSWFYDPETATLGQIPLNADSVFNFYRPGYAPTRGQIAAAGLVAPELQITDESTVAGYVRYMRDALENGFGSGNDMRFDVTDAMALAMNPQALVDQAFARLLGDGGDYSALKSQVLAAVNSIDVPASTRTNLAQVEAAKRNRVRLALLLTVASPEFIVQK